MRVTASGCLNVEHAFFTLTQCSDFVNDPEGQEYPRGPEMTVVRGQGYSSRPLPKENLPTLPLSGRFYVHVLVR